MQDRKMTDKSQVVKNYSTAVYPPHTLPLPLHHVFFFTYPFSAGYITVFKILFRLRLPLASWVG